MQTVSISITLLAFLQTVSSIAPNVNETLPDEDVNGTSGSHVTDLTTSQGNTSQMKHEATCSQQCSQQDLSYCTGYSYPIEEDLELSISCNTRDQHGRDRHVMAYIDSAINGHWKNMTLVFQELLMRVSPLQEMFPEQYFTQETAVISVLEGHKMSNSCNADYLPLKELLCSWTFVSPCQSQFKICLDSCSTLMEECFPSAMRDYDSRPVLDFICGVLSKNNNTGCYIPEDVYREDYNSRRDSEHKTRADYITILSASAGAAILLVSIIFLLAAVRYYLKIQGFIGDDVTKFDMLDPVCERARQFLSKSDLFPQLRANPSLGERGLQLKKRGNMKLDHLVHDHNSNNTVSEISLDQLDAHSLNSSASTFYCQTDHSVSTIGEVLPPETIYFEGVLSSRWKSSEDEVIALVHWVDGIGNKKKGVIKCYTDKKRKHMEDELNVISVLSHDNVCEYLWRSMGNRPHVRGMSPHLQSVMSVRNNYFCTEYYAYGSLKDFLISRGHYLMRDSWAQSFLRDIISGMSYLHELEVFHRDLKTANILVGSRPGTKTGNSCPFKLVVSDFGHSQEKHRQDCYVRDGSGGTSQYTAPEVLLSTGVERINLYKADVYSMSLVSWELLSYVCCKHNEPHNRHETSKFSPSSRPHPSDYTTTTIPRCQIQNHTAYGAYLLNRFPDISSTSTSSSVVRDYMRNMYRNNIKFRPPIAAHWSTISPIIKSLIVITNKMWHTDPHERISTAQLCRIFNLPRYNSRLSLLSNKKTVSNTISSVLCMNSVPT